MAQESIEIPTQASPNRFTLGLQIVDFRYREPSLMSDTGRLSGLAFTYQRAVTETRSAKVAVEYAQGTLAYDGALQSQTGNTTPYSSTDEFRVANLEFHWVNDPNDGGWGNSIGLGYRNTYDSKSGQYDYRRDITYYYWLFNLSRDIYEVNKVKSVLNLEMSILFGGGAKTYLSDVAPAYSDVNFAFQSGLGFKASIETTLPVFENKEMLVGLSYKYWTIADSKTEYVGNGAYGVEPHNNTALTSITIGYVF